MIDPTEYKDGTLSVRIDLLLNTMHEQDKLDLAQRLSCEDAIIQYVVDQITEGGTEDGSRGIRAYPPQPSPQHPLDKASRQIAKASSEIARREIERLEGWIKSQGEEVDRLRNELAVARGERNR